MKTIQACALMLMCCLGVVSFSGCGAVDYSKMCFSCKADSDCPGGSCRGGSCNGCALANPTENPPPDGTSNGCAHGEPIALGPNTVGCVGTFGSGQLASLCGAGYHLCNTIPITDVACKAIEGHFFASAQIACQNAMGTTPRTGFNCSWQCAMDPSKRYIVGCGKSNGDGGGAIVSYDVDPPLTRCGGFNRVTVCNNGQVGGGGSSNWRCPMSQPPADGDLGQLASSDLADGAMCCKNF